MAAIKYIRELANALKNGAKLLDDMFVKRKNMAIDYDTALDILDEKENTLQLLLRYGIIEQNGDSLEIAENYLRFFEEVLDANETISVALVKEYIDKLKDAITAYQLANDTVTRSKYMRSCNRSFRAIDHVTKRNIVDLKRNADDTYKQEENYKIKKLHLQRLDEKRKQIETLIAETERLIDDEEHFINNQADVDLRQTVSEVKAGLRESVRSLLNIESQIIIYLNKIDYKTRIVKKLHQLKYLKDQVMLESESDIKEVLTKINPVWFEPKPRYSTKISLNFLRNEDEGLAVLDDVKKQLENKTTIKERLSPPIAKEALEMQEEELRVFDHNELMNSFEAQSNDLFKFIWHYNFQQPATKEERLVLFLQMASQFADRLHISDQMEENEEVSYPIIHLKKHSA